MAKENIENTEVAQVLGQTLAKYRKAANLSQFQLAEISGLSNDAISRMERGAIMLTIPRLYQFADIFGCHVSDFLLESPITFDDQLQQLAHTLHKLTPSERTEILDIIYSLLHWRIASR